MAAKKTDPARFITVNGDGKGVTVFATEAEAETHLKETRPIRATVWQRPEGSEKYIKCATFENLGMNGVAYSRV